VEDIAHESSNAAAQPSAPTDANTIGGPQRDQVGSAATSKTAVDAPTEKDAAPTESVAHGPTNPVAVPPSPPADANNATASGDQYKTAQAPVAAATPAAEGGAAAKDAAPAPTAVTRPPTDHASTASDEPPPSAPVKDAQFYRQQGIASYRKGDLPMAIADFDLAIRLDPNLEDVYIDRGIVLYRLHQSERAFADVAQAMRIEHSHRNEPPLPRARPAD
jgi:hypothetical protein